MAGHERLQRHTSDSSGGNDGSGSGVHTARNGRQTLSAPRVHRATGRPPLLVLLVVLLSALAPEEAAAQRARGCVMARCARCQMLPAPYSPTHNRRPRLVRTCVKPARGYALLGNRRRVKTCAGGYAAKSKRGPCRRCKEGLVAPMARMGESSCQTCFENTAPNTARSRCLANAGYYGNGIECPVDFYCYQGYKYACPAGTGTLAATASKTCPSVKEGYYWNPTLTRAFKCAVDTFAAAERLKTAANAASCATCPSGLGTAGATGSTGCGFVKPGYFWNATAKAAQPCGVNTYRSGEVAITSSAALTCLACSNGTNTNNATTQASCNWLSPGYNSFDGRTAAACPADSYRAGIVPLAVTACTICSTGFSTNGLTAQASCNFIAAGYSNNGTATSPVASPCPVNTFFPTVRNFTAALAGCTACTGNLSTNGTTAQTQCYFVPAGYYYAGNQTALPCATDTYSPTARNYSVVNATTCTVCGAGYTTNNATAATGCSTYILPGYYVPTGVAGSNASLCVANTYSASVRAAANATTCTSCPTGSSTNGTTGNTACAYIAAGYYYTGSTFPPCGVDTYSPVVRSTSDPSAGTCTPCAPGTSTFNKTGQVVCTATVTVPAGYFYNSTTAAAQACPVDTWYGTARPIASATSCTACSTGYTTNGATASTDCATYVAAGYLWNATQPDPCGVDTYAAAPRAILTDPTVATCTACPGGTSTSGQTGQTACV